MKARHKKPLLERFYEKVNKTNTCWLWTGARIEGMGYGILRRGTRNEGTILAHRLSWELSYGFIPKKMQVCHKCDNPICINPDHLFLGTQYDNIQDMISKSRDNTNGRRKLSQHNIDNIRGKYLTGHYSLRSLAEIYGVGHKQIHRIVTFENWK